MVMWVGSVVGEVRVIFTVPVVGFGEMDKRLGVVFTDVAASAMFVNEPQVPDAVFT